MILINSSSRDTLKMFQPFLPIYLPVGIGALLAVLEQERIKAKFVDEQIENNLLESIREGVKELTAPYIFGFGVLTASFRSAIKLSKQLKELYPDSIILFGGIHPTALPEECLAYDHIDLVLRGEGDIILPKLYRLIKNKEDHTHLESLSYKRDGQIIHNPKAPIIRNLDDFPPFPYHLFADKKEYELIVMSSRGCPYQCIFCSNRVTTERGYRYKKAESIVEELDIIYNKYGRKYVNFLDDNLLVNHKRIYALIEEIKKRGLHKKMTFSFQARGDNTNEKILKDLYDAGFKTIFFGIETASERIMKLIKKGETVAQVVEAVRIAKKIGYYVYATFIYAFPTETHQDRMGCLKLSKELGLDMVRFNNATPYPGTELYEMAKQERRLNVEGLYENFNAVLTFIENPFRKIPFSYVPKGASENEIRNDLLFSYLSFFLRFGQMKKVFSSIELQGGVDKKRILIKLLRKAPVLGLLGFMVFVKYSKLAIDIIRKRDTSISTKELRDVFACMLGEKTTD